MMRTPDVTAILLNYRDAKRSLSCIESVLAEGADHVLVWDNSADEGLSATEIAQKNPDTNRVQVKVSETNLGFAAGVNRAVEQVLRDNPKTWIFLINNDAVLRSGALTALHTALQGNPSAKLVVPLIDNAGTVTGKNYYQRLSGLLFFDKPKFDCFPYPCGCAFLFAPERLHLPLFNEKFFMYGEDCELGYRLSGQEEIVYLDQVLVNHEGSASSGLGSMFYEERMVACHWLLAGSLAKSFPQLIIYILVRFFVLSARACLRACRYCSIIPFRALWRGTLIAMGKIR
jgi:GT2 family glycosyltransferase